MKRNNHVEDDIQKEFFRVLPAVFPRIPAKLFFAVPNGGRRNKLEAYRLKLQGVKSGISDTILLVPTKSYNCLCMEFKTNEGVQSKEQKEFQKQVYEYGGMYIIVRSVEDAINSVKKYLKT